MRKQRPKDRDLIACCHSANKQRGPRPQPMISDSKPQALCTHSQIYKLARDFQVSPEVKGSCGGLSEDQRGSATLQSCRWDWPANWRQPYLLALRGFFPAPHSQNMVSTDSAVQSLILPQLYSFRVHFALNIILLLKSNTLELHAQLVSFPGTSKQL